MDYKVAILLTTFIRDELLYKTLQTIVEFFPKDAILLIADQGYETEKKLIEIAKIQAKIPCEYFKLEFDCGLSCARNYLVEKAQLHNCQYCLLTADSIQLTKKTQNLDSIIGILEKNEEIGIIGFDILGRQPWEYYMVLTEGFKLIKSTDIIEYEGQSFTKVDTCRNFFLAKTKVLVEVGWDVQLKLAEHEDFFYRLKQTSYKVIFTSAISGYYEDDKSSKYIQYRNRMYGEFSAKLKQKYGIRRWLIYDQP
jgi:GT2 family glycosyltransferase